MSDSQEKIKHRKKLYRKRSKFLF